MLASASSEFDRSVTILTGLPAVRQLRHSLVSTRAPQRNTLKRASLRQINNKVYVSKRAAFRLGLNIFAEGINSCQVAPE